LAGACGVWGALIFEEDNNAESIEIIQGRVLEFKTYISKQRPNITISIDNS